MFLIPTLNDILKLDVLPENIRCYEDRCPAGLDPASFSKKLLKRDTGYLNHLVFRERHRVKPGATKPERSECVYCLPGVIVQLVLLISFIKKISYEAQFHIGER